MSERLTRVYVAGPSREMERCESAMRIIEASPDCELTYDWAREMRVMPGAVPFEECARRDMIGVLEADIVLVLCPSEDVCSEGMWVELGMALAAAHTTTGKAVIVSSPVHERTPFFDLLADTIEGSDARAIARVLRMAA